MAQPKPITLRVALDVADVRRKIKRVLAETQEANRELARLEERLERLRLELAESGIRLEVE